MAQVKCTRANRSDLISGVVFEDLGTFSVSEEVSDDVAEHLVSVGGYELYTPVGNESLKNKSAKKTAQSTDTDN
jgi:hypothetical protein